MVASVIGTFLSTSVPLPPPSPSPLVSVCKVACLGVTFQCACLGVTRLPPSRKSCHLRGTVALCFLVSCGTLAMCCLVSCATLAQYFVPPAERSIRCASLRRNTLSIPCACGTCAVGYLSIHTQFRPSRPYGISNNSPKFCVGVKVEFLCLHVSV